jgi:hypothetical protein
MSEACARMLGRADSGAAVFAPLASGNLKPDQLSDPVGAMAEMNERYEATRS